MKLVTKAYGPVEIDERQKVFFPYGILGFEHLKNYVLLDARQQPFYWLQSVDIVDIAFVLISPQIFRPDFILDVDHEELKEIGIEDPKQALVFSIVTIPENPSEMTAYSMLKDRLKDVLDTLTERERAVLDYRFGLTDGYSRTLEEVGKQFNVTRERIRQIEAKALRKLRHPTRIRKLEGFLEMK